MFKERRPTGVDGEGLNDYGHVLETRGNIPGRSTGSRLSDGTGDPDEMGEAEGIGGRERWTECSGEPPP